MVNANIILFWLAKVNSVWSTVSSKISYDLFQADDFKKHEKSKDHKFAVQARIIQERGDIERATSTAYDSVKSAIIATMKNVYFLAKGDFAKEKLPALTEHTRLMVGT